MRNANRTRLRRGAAVAASLTALAGAGAAGAFQALPPGAQVNDDAAAGINKTLSVSGEDPTNADVVGGALTAGKPAVPWSIFRQGTTGHDQIFSRSFAAGAWTTRGNGTVGGRSSASPTFSGSLNFDQTADGEAPEIDFAGTGRTVPWATWYEETSGTGFSADQIFASRFDNSGDANQGKWLFEGQGRGNGGSGPQVPSLNIHTDRSAENPSIAGGTTVAGNAPAPWVTWEENDGKATDIGPSQIFTSKAVKPTVAPACPADGLNLGKPVSTTGAVNTFCWQQVGIERLASGQSGSNNTVDPSQNVDTTRDGVEPAIAFTGTNDTVPWVVWYEEGTSGVSGLHGNEMVFAAKAVAPATPAPTGTVDGGFNWIVVGNTTQGILDNTPTTGGPCAASATAEGDCSLNKNASNDAEDPRIAAGTMTAGTATVPWITWTESVNGVDQIFVSRLVGTGAAAHFEIANNGSPISLDSNPSIRPDITFSGNTPYVTWRENTSGTTDKLFVGHFINPANPTFVLDESDVSLTPDAMADVREPISSGCTDNPFNSDGSACQGSAIGTPFYLFTQGTAPRSLFAGAYAPATPVTGVASAITQTTATIVGTVDPQGAAAQVKFEYGPTTAYGQTTTPTSVVDDDADDPFTAALTGLTSGTLIHYRADVTTDFGTIDGPDQTFTTTAVVIPPPPGPGRASAGSARASGTSVTIKVSCSGTTGQTCAFALGLTSVETLRGHTVLAVSARAKKTHKKVTVGTARAALNEGQTATVTIKLNGTGKSLLAKLHTLPTKLVVTQTLTGGHTSTLTSQTVTFKTKKPRKHGH